VPAVFEPDLYLAVADCEYAQRNYSDAVTAYRACLEADPEFPQARNELGRCLIRMRDYEGAEKVLREAMATGADEPYPRRNLCTALKRMGRYTEAIDVIRGDTRSGELTSSAKRQLEELGALLEKQKAQHINIVKPSESNTARETDETDSEASAPRKASPTRKGSPICRESLLEAMFELQIQQTGEAFGRRLRIVELQDGRYGRQFYIAGIGRIDILAEDLESGELVVIEFKKDKGEDEVVGQTSRYMGWVREKLAHRSQLVCGIICVAQTTERLRLAAANIPGMEIREYGLATWQA
jgi:tetratricopeptide (TPR) repeat protein